jgi:YfiH family protein
LIVQSEKITSEVADHGFFGRKGGNSSGFFSSLNCGKFVGDNETAVLQNLGIVRKELQAEKLITLKQTHGAVCIVANQQTESDLRADAIVTKTPNIAIGIVTADCVPILFLDKKNRIIGAAHAGWRGAAFGIIEATIQKMTKLGSNPRDLTAAIGPRIATESYEVDDDFIRNFNKKYDCFSTVNSKTHFDVSRYCRRRLIESGLDENNIDILEIDTYSNQKDYFSYRFAKQNTNGICGRQISAICLKA